MLIFSSFAVILFLGMGFVFSFLLLFYRVIDILFIGRRNGLSVFFGVIIKVGLGLFISFLSLFLDYL